MTDTTRDWSGWPMQLAVWTRDGQTMEPTSWKVIEPGKSGSAEEAASYESWQQVLSRGTLTNDSAASSGWPLPDPYHATALQKRAYDRVRFSPGRIITDRREAAILAPGDFPDVDTSVDPPVFQPKDEASAAEPTVEEPVTSQAAGEVVGVGQAVNVELSRRAPKVGDHVVIETGGLHHQGVVASLADNGYGDTSPVVGIATENGAIAWGYVVGWVRDA